MKTRILRKGKSCALISCVIFESSFATPQVYLNTRYQARSGRLSADYLGQLHQNLLKDTAWKLAEFPFCIQVFYRFESIEGCDRAKSPWRWNGSRPIYAARVKRQRIRVLLSPAVQLPRGKRGPGCERDPPEFLTPVRFFSGIARHGDADGLIPCGGISPSAKKHCLFPNKWNYVA
jgi:hypothetical protein